MLFVDVILFMLNISPTLYFKSERVDITITTGRNKKQEQVYAMQSSLSFLSALWQLNRQIQ